MTYSKHEEKRNMFQVLWESQVERSECMREDNIKMDLGGIG